MSAQHTPEPLTLAQVLHLSRKGCSPFLGMFERPRGYRALACDKPLRRAFIRYSSVAAREYGAAIAKATGSAA